MTLPQPEILRYTVETWGMNKAAGCLRCPSVSPTSEALRPFPPSRSAWRRDRSGWEFVWQELQRHRHSWCRSIQSGHVLFAELHRSEQTRRRLRDPSCRALIGSNPTALREMRACHWYLSRRLLYHLASQMPTGLDWWSRAIEKVLPGVGSTCPLQHSPAD